LVAWGNLGLDVQVELLLVRPSHVAPR
jgi:hypothetical protein